DEVYREFTYDGSKHYSILEEESMADNGIIIDSVSKRYSMCGARIGSLVSKNEQVIATALKFAQARLSLPTFAQIASEAALQPPHSYFDEVITEYQDRRNTLVAALKAIPGVQVGEPKGAFYCIVQLPVNNSDAFAQWLLEEFDDNGETIMVAPAAGFYSSPGVALKQVRIAYVLKKESLIRAVEIVKIALQKYKD